MTNITVHDAVYCLICGHITFSLNFHRSKGRYTIHFGSGPMEIKNKDGEAKPVSREQILELIRQDDSQNWKSWGEFVAYWKGQAEGQYRAEKNLCIENSKGLL